MPDQLILFALLVAVFALLIWGRIRYDMVAFGALMLAVIFGVVPADSAFEGFGHPAVIIVALVLVVSRGLANSGAINIVAQKLVDAGRSVSAHIAIMAGIGAGLSTVMNNVGALALLMPIDLHAARQAKRDVRETLMPLSFATILGGLVTLIGTPPNIIIASFREQRIGESFAMFDFAPVGLVCAVAGVIFVATIGRRLIPKTAGSAQKSTEGFQVADYLAELSVPDDADVVGKVVMELDDTAEAADVVIVGIIRNGRRLPGLGRQQEVRAGDVMLIEAQAQALDSFAHSLGLKYSQSDETPRLLSGGDLRLAEVVIPPGARIEGRSAMSMRLLQRFGVTVLGISRGGRRITERVRKTQIEAGDVLLVLAPKDRLSEIVDWIGALPLAERGLTVTDGRMAAIAVGYFALAVGLASFGLVNLAIALGIVVMVYVALDIVPPREIYATIEWPVVVLLGAMIPLGIALEKTGGTETISTLLIDASFGAAPWLVLTLLMVVTMTLSDVLNNTATAVIAAPIAIDLAERLDSNPDAFLMGVAVSASCAFLTPIGHKNNTLIMGPGGYAFGDYWPMGLPLEVLTIAVAVPAIVFVWGV